MKTLIVLAVAAVLAGCAFTPEERAQEAATDRFESCMDSTLASFGPFRFGTQEARLKAAEICKDVMQPSAPTAPARDPSHKTETPLPTP